jgi:hypothetical protein
MVLFVVAWARAHAMRPYGELIDGLAFNSGLNLVFAIAILNPA